MLGFHRKILSSVGFGRTSHQIALMAIEKKKFFNPEI